MLDKKYYYIAIAGVALMFLLLILYTNKINNKTEQAEREYSQKRQEQRIEQEIGNAESRKTSAILDAQISQREASKLTNDVIYYKNEITKAKRELQKYSEPDSPPPFTDGATTEPDIPTLSSLCTRYAKLTGEECFRYSK